MNIIGVCAFLMQAASSRAPAPAVAQRALPPALQEYTMDVGHSIVEFSIPFAFSRVKGRFTEAKGTILVDTATPANSSITVILQSKSIDTGWPHRDEHLRTSDFFDVAKYPTIEFQSEHVRRKDSTWVMDGTLTMHGVTKQLTIPFRLLHPPVRSSESRSLIINAEGAVRLARADFGILGGGTYNSWFNKARAATMGDSVDISLEIEGYLADAASQRPPGITDAAERLKATGVPAQVARLAELKRTKSVDDFNGTFFGADLLVRALIVSGRIPEAVELSRAMADLYAMHAARLVYAFALTTAGDKAGAAHEYAQAKSVFRPPAADPAEKFPQDDEYWYYLDQLARTAVEWGRAKDAVELARTISEIYPRTARAFTTYGLTLAAAGDTRAAAAQYAKALSLDPNETRAREWARRLP